MSDETPLKSGPLTSEEISWLGSINNIGALGGILTFGFITSFLGCKKSMLFLAFPSAAFWLLIYFGNTYYHILFARFFTGWTGACSTNDGTFLGSNLIASEMHEIFSHFVISPRWRYQHNDNALYLRNC